MKNNTRSRREFLKKVSYVAPAIVSLNAVPSFANTGSSRPVERSFIDLGPGCSSTDFGVGDGEVIRDRHHFCK